MDLGYLKVRGKEVFVSKRFLTDNFIPNVLIQSSLRTRASEGSNTYVHYVDSKSGQIWFNYSAIPKEHLKEYGLPTETEKLVHVLSNAVALEPGKFDLSLLFTFNILWFVESNWIQYVPYYAPYYTDEKSKFKLAKTHALIDLMLKLKRDKVYPACILYHTYMQMPNVHFKAGNLTHFYRKLRAFEKEGISETLMHSFTIHGRQPYKITPSVVALIKQHYTGKKRYKVSLVLKLVNLDLCSRGMDTISRGVVSRVFSDLETKNQADFVRLGKRYAEARLLPYLRRNNVEGVGVLYEIDGKDLHIKVGLKEEIVRLWLFVVRDFYSKKIIGYDFGTSENTVLALNALKMAFKEGRVVPEFILYDKHSVSNSNEYKLLKSKLVDYGVLLKRCRADNPKGKGSLENWFKFFGNNYLAMLKGYLGSGILAKGVGAKADNELELLYISKSELQTYNEMVEKVAKLIKKYNAETQHGAKSSPSKIFAEGRKKLGRNFGPHSVAFLFGEEKRITVQRRMILFTHNDKDYGYTISDRILGNKINGGEVKVFFYPENPSIIYLFSLDNKLIGQAGLDIKVSPVPRAREDIEAMQAIYLKNIQDVTDNIEELFDEIEQGQINLELNTNEILDEDIQKELDELKKEDLELVKKSLILTKPYGKSIAKVLDKKNFNYRTVRKSRRTSIPPIDKV